MATATAVGLLVDGARMPVYALTQGKEIAGLWLWVTLASIGVVVGTVLGSRTLVRIPEIWFRRVLAVILAILGGAMFYRGLQS